MDTSEKDTAAAPEEETQDWEKRYKDLQSAFTKATQENKATKEQINKLSSETEKYKQLVVELYNKNESAEDPDSDEFASKKDIEREVKNLQAKLDAVTAVNKFRVENPDLREYEDLVDYYARQNKDPLAKPDEIIANAAAKARDFIKKERKRAIELAEKEKADKTKKEAEASGLETKPKVEKTEKPPATKRDWINFRKNRFHKLSGNV